MTSYKMALLILASLDEFHQNVLKENRIFPTAAFHESRKGEGSE
jgi:hypothetical protein